MKKGKTSFAHVSGMRGAEPYMGKETAEEEALEGKENEANESSELQDSELLGTTVAQHIHGPDENGHHHLNLTALAQTLKKKRGEHEE